jgi:putative ABC transport system ATP-binding protein
VLVDASVARSFGVLGWSAHLVHLCGSTVLVADGVHGEHTEDPSELNADLIALRDATTAQLNPNSSFFGPATTTAVEKLQAALGMTQNGTLSLGQAVFEPTAVRVTTLSAQLGGTTQSGQTVMQGSSTTRQVQVAVGASQQSDMAVGDKVTITLPNNQTTPGVVSSVGTVAACPTNSASSGSSSSFATPGTDTCSSGSSGSSTTPTIIVDVTPSDSAATGTWDQAPVQVTVTTASVPGALVVPVTALLARSGGGYAVEVVDPGGPSSRVGVARTVRRCRRAGAGHGLGARRGPRGGGPDRMTGTSHHALDHASIVAGNGSVTDVAQVPVLEVDNVTKSYPGEPPVQALGGVNLTIGQGELAGIVGPSGSGKTTLLQLMGTLDRPTSGRVRITGLDVATMADDDVAYLRATRIGFIFQQFFLAEHATALDNVADGLLYAGIPRDQRRQRAIEALDLVGLGNRPSVRPTQLSGGQRQRVAIARALVGQPAVLLADEPTGNLDQATGQSILALIDQLHQGGSTIVVITHDHSIAERMLRKVEILDGHVVADTAAAATGPRRPRAGLAPPPTRAPETSPVSEEPS